MSHNDDAESTGLPLCSGRNARLESGEVECKLGIDEAGRGPVLGAMSFGVAYWPVEQDAELTRLGFMDSKDLKATQREDLFDKITRSASIGFDVRLLDPGYLSSSMYNKYNLNALSHDTAIQMIKHVLYVCPQRKDRFVAFSNLLCFVVLVVVERSLGVRVTEIYVDTVGPPHVYQKKLSEIFRGISCTVCPKADSKYSVVSAASICAKVLRDHHLNQWRFQEEAPGASGEAGFAYQYSRDFGSGYTSDARTCAWLRNHIDPVFGFPSLIRFSWKTSERLLFKGAVPVKWGIPEEDEDPDKNPAKRRRTAGDSSSSSSSSGRQQTLESTWHSDPEEAHPDEATPRDGDDTPLRAKRMRHRFYSLRQIEYMRPDSEHSL